MGVVPQAGGDYMHGDPSGERERRVGVRQDVERAATEPRRLALRQLDATGGERSDELKRPFGRLTASKGPRRRAPSPT